ncbi:uncharacterized protein LOC130926237 isoform X3 [Corythoichthys intestinalis]|uniref:uncharacterized protein LOC130926237 isoform X3 n=1 Tax=Corythoichthys intestinalis TaxID=161448 RepID=UPI0025A58BD9|nr:uncharacterized protein LOC130926237 isoform X3 [Corythoichthys intestinalis]
MRGNQGHEEQLENKKMRCPADVTMTELHPQRHDPIRIKQEESEMPYIKQEAEPETPSIKEEKQENEIANIPITVRVKSEEDEGPSENSGAAKPSSDGSFQHPTTKREGRSQPDDKKTACVSKQASQECSLL